MWRWVKESKLCLSCFFPQFQREVESPLGCSRSQQSREGDELLVTYKGFLADGTVFDSNEGKDPIRSDLRHLPVQVCARRREGDSWMGERTGGHLRG